MRLTIIQLAGMEHFGNRFGMVFAVACAGQNVEGKAFYVVQGDLDGGVHRFDFSVVKDYHWIMDTSNRIVHTDRISGSLWAIVSWNNKPKRVSVSKIRNRKRV